LSNMSLARRKISSTVPSPSILFNKPR
jgi:hypothetical protein